MGFLTSNKKNNMKSSNSENRGRSVGKVSTNMSPLQKKRSNSKNPLRKKRSNSKSPLRKKKYSAKCPLLKKISKTKSPFRRKRPETKILLHNKISLELTSVLSKRPYVLLECLSLSEKTATLTSKSRETLTPSMLAVDIEGPSVPIKTSSKSETSRTTSGANAEGNLVPLLPKTTPDGTVSTSRDSEPSNLTLLPENNGKEEKSFVVQPPLQAQATLTATVSFSVVMRDCSGGSSGCSARDASATPASYSYSKHVQSSEPASASDGFPCPSDAPLF